MFTTQKKRDRRCVCSIETRKADNISVLAWVYNTLGTLYFFVFLDIYKIVFREAILYLG